MRKGRKARRRTKSNRTERGDIRGRNRRRKKQKENGRGKQRRRRKRELGRERG